MKKFLLTLILSAVLFQPGIVSAHEAYVLTPDEFNQGLQINFTNPLAALFDPKYLNLSIFITVALILLFAVNFLLAASKFGYKFDLLIKKAAPLGPFLVRLTFSTAFLYAAYENCLFAPELSLANIPNGVVIRFLEILIGLMVLFGVLIEVAGLIGMGVYLYIAGFYGAYILTYVNFFGKMLVLFLFGLRFLTLDHFFLGDQPLLFDLRKYYKFKTPLIRLFYGLSLVYAAVTIKFLHQSLSVAVYEEYHLENFFHAGANFIAAGAGLSEVTIGLFILFGFGMRLTIVISLIFITLSLVYFQELIWPHFFLYGLSISLFINSGDFLTVDHYLVTKLRQILKIKV